MENTIKNRKFPLFGDVVALLLLVFVPQLIISLVLQLLGVVSPATILLDADSALNVESYVVDQQALGRFNAWSYPLMMLSSILAMALYIRLRAGRGAIRIKHSFAGFNPSVVLVGVVWLLSAQIILEPLILLLPQSATPSLGLGAWAIVTAVVSAPILEEILCQGLLFGAFNKRWGVVVSMLLSALLFGVLHSDLGSMIVATVAGMIFCVLYIRSSSIFATMIVHSINNAMAMTLVNFEKDRVPFSEMIGGGTAYYILYGVAVAIFLACASSTDTATSARSTATAPPRCATPRRA